ncbi:MAG TPA: hypothetical protein VNJ02_03855 [Vicinamibacterales bacterium]|nr:hypothetical protein [Vicinamibacterales bacterium]
MRGRLAEASAIGLLAAALIAAIASAVLQSPSERIFGFEAVGRHHDPFTVIAQLEQPFNRNVHTQPVTDLPAALLARATGGVTAYNWLVLLTFPLAAGAAYLLARHFGIRPAAAGFAALAYAFSPFHLAHAAYHPHIAQIHWIPLYLLALWRCLDRSSIAAVGWLLAAAIAAVFSNFYGGLILAVLTPVAAAAHWLTSPDRARTARDAVITSLALVCLAGAGLFYVAVVVDDAQAAFAFPREDLFLYSAKWWSYLVPPVAHPLLGDTVRRFWIDVGVREGLLEQQVTIGVGVLALAGIALTRRERAPFKRQAVVFTIIAVVALVCSLSPERIVGGVIIMRPSGLLYEAAPMFRAYARFGVVVQLMAVLLAAIGIERLLRSETSRSRIVCATLILLTVAEYAVSPAAQSRDVLPTEAHRWVREQRADIRAADCTQPDLLAEIDDCGEPNLADKLAAAGYTHLLLATGNGPAPAPAAGVSGLRRVAHFADAQVLAVDTPAPAIYTARFSGFYPRESDRQWSWRWLARDGEWQVVNTTATAIAATVDIELYASGRRQPLELWWDGQPITALSVDPGRHFYRLHLPSVSSGNHQLAFRAVQAPVAPTASRQSTDPRPLSVAIGHWRWTTNGPLR